MVHSVFPYVRSKRKVLYEPEDRYPVLVQIFGSYEFVCVFQMVHAVSL